MVCTKPVECGGRKRSMYNRSYELKTEIRFLFHLENFIKHRPGVTGRHGAPCADKFS